MLMILIFSLFAIEENKPLVAEHGPMRVVYSVKDSHHTIKMLKKTDMSHKGKYVYQQMNKMSLDLTEGEHLSMDKGFECYGKNNTYAYGIVTAKVAREKESFNPLRAWLVNETDFTLDEVKNPYTVKCRFEGSGDTDYPFYGQ